MKYARRSLSSWSLVSQKGKFGATFLTEASSSNMTLSSSTSRAQLIAILQSLSEAVPSLKGDSAATMMDVLVAVSTASSTPPSEAISLLRVANEVANRSESITQGMGDVLIRTISNAHHCTSRN